MRIGVALGVLDLETGAPVQLSRLADQAQQAESLGYASAWVMDHFWIERFGGRRGAHDPFVTLAYLAARTSAIQLGVLVACAPFRHPAQLAREAAALADAAPGRTILGLGAGWYQPEFKAFDFPFERKVARLEEYVPIVGRLLAGEKVTLGGHFYNLAEAGVLTTAPPPPLWVAASGPRMLELTARHASGWNVAWHGPDPRHFSELLAQLRAAEGRAGRTEPVLASVGVLALPYEGAELEAATRRALRYLPDADAETLGSRVALGGPERLEEVARGYERAGAGHLIFNFSPQPFGAFDETALERAAPLLRARKPTEL